MDRSASAVWHGTIKEGSGTISTQSGTLKDTQYSFKARFAEGVGTNPEELIAAAHAGCFTMALSGQITNAGFTPDSLETTAVLTLDMHGAQPTITKIHLTTKAKIPGIDKAKFDELAHNAAASLRKRSEPGALIRSQKLAIDWGCGEREEIGRVRKADRSAAISVERFDPEGRKSPKGEWRLVAQSGEPLGKAETGLKQGSSLDRGEPVRVVEPKGRTDRGTERRRREVAGRER